MFVAILVQRAWAEGPGLPDAPNGIGLVPLLVRTVLSLGLVVILIYGVVFVLRRMVSRQRPSGSGALIRVVGSAFIGPKKGVYLLEVLDRILVVGVTDTTMVLLSEITDPSVVQSVAHTDATSGDARFLVHLRSLMSPCLQRFWKANGGHQGET